MLEDPGEQGMGIFQSVWFGGLESRMTASTSFFSAKKIRIFAKNSGAKTLDTSELELGLDHSVRRSIPSRKPRWSASGDQTQCHRKGKQRMNSLTRWDPFKEMNDLPSQTRQIPRPGSAAFRQRRQRGTDDRDRMGPLCPAPQDWRKVDLTN